MTSTRFNDDYRASIPVGRLGTAADVARAVAFLTDAESGFITGTTTDVNGGGHMQ
ncbi:SDR family oxidoreductase [Leucobacter sp. UCD-THU]|nr:SDR family oxidoreductase [Leucobacter sp. UCD-THU]